MLVTYIDDLQVGLERAETLTREGELGQAVWTYLEVLEVDPDNPTARQQVGQAAAAVRQFDRATEGRRWFHKLQRQARFRHWMNNATSGGASSLWLGVGAGFLLFIVAAFVLGYILGSHHHLPSPPAPP